MGPLIEFQGITKQFKKEVVLHDIDLQVQESEIFGIVGRSGAGKSTLMRILMGFYPPDGGKIIYKGEDITADTHGIRQIVGLTTQENSFYPKLSIVENLKYYGNMYGLSKEQLVHRVPLLIDLMHLSGHGHVLAEDLSGGMKRRLDFAISLIHDPDLLILDEPTTGLDPILRENIWDIIWQIKNAGKTVIVISHFFEELERHCDRIGIMNGGRFLSVASPRWYKRTYPQNRSFAQTFRMLVEYDDK